MTEPLPESTPPKLHRSPLAEGAYGAIKKMIVETTLSPGQTLTETQLAVTLGISRSPIRQALVRLQEDGFVEIEPWKQARVAPLTPDVVREIYSVRTALEARAARESAPFIADADIVAMDATLKRLEPRIRVGDYAEFIAIEHQFHSLFIDNCRNRLLRDLLDDLQDHLERVRRYYRDEVGLSRSRSSLSTAGSSMRWQRMRRTRSSRPCASTWRASRSACSQISRRRRQGRLRRGRRKPGPRTDFAGEGDYAVDVVLPIPRARGSSTVA